MKTKPDEDFRLLYCRYLWIVKGVL